MRNMYIPTACVAALDGEVTRLPRTILEHAQTRVIIVVGLSCRLHLHSEKPDAGSFFPVSSTPPSCKGSP